MRFFGKKMTEHRLPESTDRLKDADATTRVRYVLDLWKEKSNGQFSFYDSQGKFSFSFRGGPIEISLHEVPRHALCRVLLKSPLPHLVVKYPFDATCIEKLMQWFDRRIYSSLEFKDAPNEQNKNQKFVSVTTKACLSERHITSASILHTLTEITDGYWQLAKVLFQSGLLIEAFSGFSYGARHAVEEILNSLEDVKTGVLTGKLAEQMLPSDFPSMLKKEVVPLPFHNMIGDEPGGTMDQLTEHIRARALAMGASPERAHSLVGSGHIDMYSIQSKYLKDFTLCVSELLHETGKDFQLETIHQGFPALPDPKSWGRKVFLAIRYAVKLADASSIEGKTLREWGELMPFTNPPRIPTQYSITNESVKLFVTLPFALEEKANYAYPEFSVDNQTYDLNKLTQSLKDFSTEIENEIRQMRYRAQMLNRR